MATVRNAVGQVVLEQWSNGTQGTDPAAGYVQRDLTGAIVTQRALTGAETALLAAQDNTNATQGNQATIQQRVDAAITTMTTWVTNNPTGATLTAGQTLTVAKMLIGLAKLVRGALNDTAGT